MILQQRCVMLVYHFGHNNMYSIMSSLSFSANYSCVPPVKEMGNMSGLGSEGEAYNSRWVSVGMVHVWQFNVGMGL